MTLPIIPTHKHNNVCLSNLVSQSEVDFLYTLLALAALLVYTSVQVVVAFIVPEDGWF